MFDSPSCDRAFTQFPLWVSWNSPILLLMISGAIGFLIFWLVRHPQHRRRFFRSPLFYAVAGLVLTVILLMVGVKDALFLPSDPGVPVNAIAILGRGEPLRSERVQAATQLWQSGRSPLIFVSGTGDTPPTLDLLRANQIPDTALNGENCSLTTRENAQFTAAILPPQDYPTLLLITDPPHLWRSLFEFRAQGYNVIPYPSPLPEDWSIGQTTFLAFREVIFLVLASGQLFFFPDSAFTPADPVAQTLLQQAQQYAQGDRQ
ncbi:MAG: YdcF family protein [Desertifilum sp.]|nr:YdcF family protein [Desertifilum sp.]